MRVFIQNLTAEPQKGRVRLTVQIGDEPAKQFLADFNGDDEIYKYSSLDEELFMRLSNLAITRYCNCAVYQMELMGIIGAFVSAQAIPPFSIELGTTDFGFPRPSKSKIFFDRLRRPLLNAWYWWAFRKVRKENILKYGKS